MCGESGWCGDEECSCQEGEPTSRQTTFVCMRKHHKPSDLWRRHRRFTTPLSWVLASVRDAIKIGKLTKLQKPDGGMQGVVARDIIRRIVAEMMSQRETRHKTNFKSTIAGCECIVHVLQGIVELDPQSHSKLLHWDHRNSQTSWTNGAFRFHVLWDCIQVFVGRRQNN